MAMIDKKPSSSGLAIAGLILNILILPGLGSMIAGYRKTGLWQLILAIVSIPLMFVLIGFVTWLAAWVWGLVTGIQMIKATG